MAERKFRQHIQKIGGAAKVREEVAQQMRESIILVTRLLLKLKVWVFPMSQVKGPSWNFKSLHNLTFYHLFEFRALFKTVIFLFRGLFSEKQFYSFLNAPVSLGVTTKSCR